MKKCKRYFIILCALTVIFIIAREIYCMVMYLYNISIRRGDKMFLTRLIDLHNETEAVKEDYETEGTKWYEETPHCEKITKSFDGIPIYSRIYRQNSNCDKWVIAVHGFGGSGELMDYAGREFYKMGYNVIIPDCRGHGKSGGDFISMGWFDRLDILSLCGMIEKINGNAEICLYGVSMGAAAVLMCGGDSRLNKSVRCIVADCGFTSVYDIFKVQMKRFKVPHFPLLDIVSGVCVIKNGFGFRRASVINAVKRCDVPVLFIHGDRDGFVPVDMMEKLYCAKKGYKDKLIINGAGHGVSALKNPNLYWEKVRKFTEDVNCLTS